MFITFSMFIWLIILTILMIALIIYLTITDEKKHRTPYTSNDLPKDPTVPNQNGSFSNESESWKNQQTDSYSERSIEKNPYSTESTDTVSQDDETLFTILPYPKDNEAFGKKN